MLFEQDSGWTGALTEAGVTSSATADSFLSAVSVTETRQANQVTACSLYKFLKPAYPTYVEELIDPTDARSFEDRCEHRKLQSPQFWNWHPVLTMELALLLFIRSLKESNISLYRQALCQLISYMYMQTTT